MQNKISINLSIKDISSRLAEQLDEQIRQSHLLAVSRLLSQMFKYLILSSNLYNSQEKVLRQVSHLLKTILLGFLPVVREE